MPEVDDITPEAMDNYIRAYKMISCGDTMSQGSFRRRKRDVEGNTIGKANINYILDTRTDEVELEDGSMNTYYVNFIAYISMISLMRIDSNTSCLDQYWITRHMIMPYLWRIKIWL